MNVNMQYQTKTRCQVLLPILQKRNIFFSLKNGILEDISNGFRKIVDKDPKDYISKHFTDILPWTNESVMHYHEQSKIIMQEKSEYVEFEMQFHNSNDSLSTLHIIQYARFDDMGNITAIDGLAEDITHKKEIEQEKQNLIDIIDDFAVYVKTNSSGVIMDASDGFYKEFRADESSIIGQKINIFQSGKTSDENYKKLWNTIQSGSIFEQEIENCTLDMEKHWYHVKIVPQLNHKKIITGYLAFYHNIDDKIKLKKEAHTDPLTQLTNRQYFQDIQSQINIRDFDIMMIDIDHFKKINDTYGHQTGDKVLKKIAEILKNKRCNDDILIRFGGEEFLFLLYNPECDLRKSKKVSQDIRATIEKVLIDCKDIIIKPTVSIGMEAHTQRCTNLDEAILHADQMLYLAKRRGRNRVELYSESNSELSDKNKKRCTITEIKKALDNDRLICLYQPIVNEKKEIIKYESLVRLINEEGKMMTPDTFLPLIKNTNIYVDLTKKVIDYNFNFFKSRNYKFTFNLSFSDLLNESIVSIINQKLDTNPKIGKRITIELLENEMIDNLDDINKIMKQLRKKGIKFAIDDFGSGYANFGNILKLNFDYLKIDGEIIKNVEKSKFSRSMVESLSAFAKKAKIKTIAEFIENETIFEFAKQYNIDLYQGYYLGKPVSNVI